MDGYLGDRKHPLIPVLPAHDVGERHAGAPWGKLRRLRGKKPGLQRRQLGRHVRVGVEGERAERWQLDARHGTETGGMGWRGEGGVVRSGRERIVRKRW